MRRPQAETLALKALAWVVSDRDLLGVFMGATGLDASDLKETAASPEGLAAVLDFVLMDDDWVSRFADEAKLEPETVLHARAALPGGDLPHWT